MTDVKRLRARATGRRAPLSSHIFFSIALALAATLLMLARAPVAHLEAPQVYAIKDAQIVTGTGKTIAKGTIVFRDGLITEVGESVKIPADARVINGTGLTVYPGLIDGYTNIGLAAPAQPQRGAGAAQAAAAAGQQAQPEQALGDPSISAADQVKPGGTSVEDARAVGITAALTSPRQGIFPGQSAVINLAGDETSKLVVRAPVALTVQFTTSAGFFGVYPNSLMGTVAFIRQSFYDAAHYRDELDRYTRSKRGVNRPEYDKKLAALQPALRGDMPVLFVVTSDGDVRRALRIADEFKLKPILAGALYGYRVADLIKAKNASVILSVDFPRRPAELPEDEDEPLRALEDRAETPKGAARLAQAGVKFAFTSGTLRPQDFIANVQKAVENGLSKNDALRALTASPAEIFGVADQLGTIEVGKIANLVVTNGDLLVRETRVRYVFIDGAEIELKKPETAAQRPGAPGGATVARPGATADPVGEWELVVRSPQGDVNSHLSLRREGDRLAGTLTGPNGATPVQNAIVTGNQLRFNTSLQIGTDTMEATITATIEGDSMRGIISLAALGSFEFTGTRPR
jgi:imidazolonepropionase-like amidohydrolase